MQQVLTPQPTTKTPSERFTGDVWLDMIVAGQEPSRLRAAMVRFSPGARTAWHSHAVGQTLHVVAGVALVGARDGTVLEVHPGQTVQCPPDEEHWHGAAPERFMQHLALWEGTADGSPETTWAEHVTDDDYGRPRTRA